jgi:NTP pyrophosphatase (non-canonical NTP hydrolase)
MNSEQIQEIMNILQEECAEVIQAISKINRFGLDNFKPGKPKTNKEHLEEELGDVLAMVDLLIENSVVSKLKLDEATAAKKIKLQKWSKIYEQN